MFLLFHRKKRYGTYTGFDLHFIIRFNLLKAHLANIWLIKVVFYPESKYSYHFLFSPIIS